MGGTTDGTGGTGGRDVSGGTGGTGGKDGTKGPFGGRVVDSVSKYLRYETSVPRRRVLRVTWGSGD